MSQSIARYRSNLAHSLAMLKGSGTQQRKDIASRYRTDIGYGLQDAISRGLSGSTILSGMRRGAARDREASYGRLDESLMGQRQQVYGQHSGALAQAMQREEEQRYQQQYQQQTFQAQQQFQKQQQQFQAQQQAQQYQQFIMQLNANQNAQRRSALASPQSSYRGGGFQTVPSRSGYSMPGTFGSLVNTRAYQRANRL